MRKITKDAFNAFVEGKPFRRAGNGHTTVVIDEDGSRGLYLHHNPIALYDPTDGSVTISTCGWNTVTTRERLRPFAYVSTMQGECYLGGTSWDGSLALVGHIRDGQYVPLPKDGSRATG